MSQSASQSVNFIGGRAIGSELNGHKFGGIYYPKHYKNGKEIPARFECNLMLNSPDYTGNNGEVVQGRKDVIHLVAWNSKNAAAGKGLADTMAKCVSVGKEITLVNVELQSFMKTVRIDGQPAVNKAGEPVKVRSVSFVARSYRNVRFGQDSDNTIKSEIAAYNGAPSFFGRPADSAKWAEERKARMAVVFGGEASYGYARVIVPEGASLVNPAAGGNIPAAGATPTQAAAQLGSASPAGM